VEYMGENLDKVKKEVLDFMSKGDYIKPSKLLNATFRSIDKTDIPRFGDLLGELARKYPEMFIEKIYIAFQYQLRNYKKKEILYELEKYIIENYCLMEGEILVDSFYGSLRETYNHINKGRIFLTNFRVIACGFPLLTDATSPIGPKKGSQIRKDMIHGATGAALRKSMNKHIKELNIISYGYYYPIHNANRIKRGKSAVSFKANMNIYITPGKMKENRARKEEILSNIEKILIQNQ